MSAFKQGDALEAFRLFLGGRGLNEATVGVRDGFETMLDFYGDARASGCALDEDGDMLLFQWGTYLRHRPDGAVDEVSNLDLTRQLIYGVGEDDDIWQLGLTFEFDPTEFRGLKRGNKWCHSLEDLPQFREYVLASAPFAAGSRLQIRRTTLNYGCAG
ncbi:MAG TPA: hypothetical protein VGF29_13455 [Hyphomicrobiaceae bacterium]|jgi:hypothetical protein